MNDDEIGHLRRYADNNTGTFNSSPILIGEKRTDYSDEEKQKEAFIKANYYYFKHLYKDRDTSAKASSQDYPRYTWIRF